MCLTQSMLESDTGPDYNIANTYREEDTFYITPQGPYKRKNRYHLTFMEGAGFRLDFHTVVTPTFNTILSQEPTRSALYNE